MKYELATYVSTIVAALILSVLAIKSDVHSLQRDSFDGKRFFSSFRDGDEVTSLSRLAPLGAAFLLMAKDKWGIYALFAVPLILLIIIIYELVKKQPKREPLNGRSKKLLLITPLVILGLLACVIVIGGWNSQTLLFTAVMSLFVAFCTPVFTVAVNWLVPGKQDKDNN